MGRNGGLGLADGYPTQLIGSPGPSDDQCGVQRPNPWDSNANNHSGVTRVVKPNLNSWLICWLAAGTVGWCLPTQLRSEESRPLPQLEDFLEHVKENLTGDRLLQSQYTFDRHETTRFIDSQGEVKESTSKKWEVFPSVDPELSYERLIEKDGVPIKPSQIENQDRKHRKKIEDRKQLTPELIEKKRREAKEKEQRQIEEVFRLFRFRMQGRDTLEGVSTIVLSFEPRPSYRPALSSIRPLRKMQGQAWICEDDYQLVKVEIETIEPLSFAWGVVARLHKGARMRFTRQRVNDEVWLPAESHFLGSGRILLVKKFRVEDTNRYSDYRKFTVEDSINYLSDPTSSLPE